MSRFHIAIEEPVEIRPRLARPAHWKEGRSAFELSTAWMTARGVPAAVRSVLGQAPEWRDAMLLEGMFERRTGMPGRGQGSQTDLLVLVRLAGGNALLAVEGKVDEPFGPRVGEWLAEAPVTADPAGGPGTPRDANRPARLAGLCAMLEVEPDAVVGLPYQLFHRTCAAILEARRFGCGRGIMLVHSFADSPPSTNTLAGFAAFSIFAEAVGLPVIEPDSLSPPRHTVAWRCAWAGFPTGGSASDSTRRGTASLTPGTGRGPLDQLARLYLPITRCACCHSLRDSV